MKHLSKILALSLVILFAGCASLPPPAEMKKEVENFTLPKLPEDGKAIVYIVRPSSVGGLIRFNVFVDDKEAASEMGYTRGKQFIYFNVLPGEHKILSKAENWAEATITANAGDIIFLEQEAKMGVMIARNNLLKVEDYKGKYHVKHSKLGTIIKADK